ncbi:MAG: hypothetical protein LUI60_06800 [Clostridia bacterium]|nr:hypothetical protein [Clostridia bacterium]
MPHFYLPENIDRAVFFDVDMIVNGSLEEFYKMDIGENYLAACHGIVAFTKKLKEIAQDNAGDNYVNSGAIVYNLSKFRENNIDISFYKRFLEISEQKLFEEYLLNNMLYGNIYYLMPYDYNYNAGATSLYSEYCEKHNVVPKKLIYHYMDFGNKCAITKPWDAYEYYYQGKPNNVFDENMYAIYKVWWDYALELSPCLVSGIINQVKKSAAEKKLSAITKERDRWKTYEKTFKYLIQNDMANITANHYSLANLLTNRGINKIAIFGNQEIAHVLISLLKDSAVNIAYVVDNVPVKGIKTLRRDTTKFPVVDLMIVADVMSYKSIEERLNKLKVPFKFVNSAEFLQSLKQPAEDENMADKLREQGLLIESLKQQIADNKIAIDNLKNEIVALK